MEDMNKTNSESNANQMETDDDAMNSDFPSRTKSKPSSDAEDLNKKLIIDKIN